MRNFVLFLVLVVSCAAQVPYRSARFPSKTVGVGGGVPTVASATLIADNTGVTSLSLVFSQLCSIGAGGSGGMSITPSGGAATLGSPTGFPGGTAVWPVTTRYVLGSETLTYTYAQPGNGIKASSGGADLANITTQSVTNSSNVVAYDLFTRADSGTLGANWTDVFAGFGIVSNQASATLTDAQAITAYSATTPSANSRASITLRTTPTPNIGVAVYSRLNVGTVNGYLAYIDGSTVQIIRNDSGAPTTLASNSTTFASGDVFGFEANGTVLTAYKNGVAALSISDANYGTAQTALVATFITGSQTFAFDNFVLQNLP